MLSNFAQGVLVAGVALLAFATGCRGPGPDRPDISRVGGTLLVYEVPEADAGKPGRSVAELVMVVRMMIDPTDLRPYTVRAVEASRIEVAIPRSRDPKGDEEQVKDLKMLLTDGPDDVPRLGLRLVQEKTVEPK